jgi:hypothetical protein
MVGLRVVAPRPAPNTLALLPESVGRFGDLREPVELEMTPASQAFRHHASAQGIPLELAVGLAIERELLLQDADAAGFARCATRAQLTGAAKVWSATELGPGRLNRAYLEVLIRGYGKVRASKTCEPTTVTIPSRLCERAVAINLAIALVPPALEESIAWERAAVFARRTMTDWGLRTLLVSTRQRPENS